MNNRPNSPPSFPNMDNIQTSFPPIPTGLAITTRRRLRQSNHNYSLEWVQDTDPDDLVVRSSSKP